MTDIVYNKNGVPFDIDSIATDLNGKMDKDGVNAACSICIENWHDNNGNWYRIYSDGWCEQGGRVDGGAVANTISLLKPYKDANYTAVSTAGNKTTVADGINNAINSKTNTGFSLDFWTYNWGTPSSAYYCNWFACGYIR